jgi:hypothetical protein
MLNQPTLEKLQTMKLHGMADAFRAQLENPFWCISEPFQQLAADPSKGPKSGPSY